MKPSSAFASGLLLLAAGATTGEYTWVRASPPGSGAWQERWTPGRFPMALVPTPGPAGRLWMVGGLGVFSSGDGTRWQRESATLPWGERYGATAVHFQGELWSLGGTETRVLRNEVWRSGDGKTWRKATAEWSPRNGHTAASFRKQLWVLGGDDGAPRNDVWASSDGRAWEAVAAHAGWSPRGGHATVVWRERLWVIGGGGWSDARADVWASPNGREWSLVTSTAPWGPRVAPGVAVYNDRLWVFGGVRPGGSWINDVWSSADGARWERHAAAAPWTPRAAQFAAAFANRLWLYGGKGIEADGRGGFASDVWYLTAGER